jgi:hypothetical protein
VFVHQGEGSPFFEGHRDPPFRKGSRRFPKKSMVKKNSLRKIDIVGQKLKITICYKYQYVDVRYLDSERTLVDVTSKKLII